MNIHRVLRISMFFILQLLVALGANADAHAILNWEPTIPVTQDEVVETIANEAGKWTHEDDDGAICGGEVNGFQLADYYTFEDYEGLVTHQLVVQFLLSLPVDYCADEVLKACEVKVRLSSSDDMHIGKVSCTDL